MFASDFAFVIRWWTVFFLTGIVFLPLAYIIFNSFKDKGYIFAKTLGIILISFSVFLISFLKIVKFSRIEIVTIFFIFAALSLYIKRKFKIKFSVSEIKLFVIEEIIFFCTLAFWSFIRGNSPDIHGLEKFMDFGFLNSILRSSYFPPSDMWYSGFSINYYYFGHLLTAVVIKASDISSNIGYNLMLATLFALSFTSTLSLGLNIFSTKKISLKAVISGLLGATILALGGNLTTIYTFFKAYQPLDKAVPFWTLPFIPFSFPNNYWYPNATRFIPFTIHEFPLYSFVVSDLHGHVLDIPIVLLSLAFSFSLLIDKKINAKSIIFASFLLALMYMTNAWDGLIYMLLLFIIFFFISVWNKNISTMWIKFVNFIKNATLLVFGFFIFITPFSLSFKPFVSGIGIICAPKILTDIGKFGPFLFEAEHCQRSPFWQLVILYGFFYFFVVAFIFFFRRKKKHLITTSDKFISILIILSTILIIVPEFIYIKDIYPLHYRANTMFKLVYEAFILLSISCGYIIVRILTDIKDKKKLLLFFIPTLILLYLIVSYPVFAINSYYNNLNSYKGIDGTKYLLDSNPSDYKLINWLNKSIKGLPVTLEAVGDSYTDYARISANTGIPTIVGWPVHEWLWRGSYDIVSPRISDVEKLYTSNNLSEVKELLKKYKVNYVVVSSLEKEKYANLNEDNFKKLGEIIFEKDKARLYKINL